jgi:transcriptional regulator with XRE-family HTH domain
MEVRLLVIGGGAVYPNLYAEMAAHGRMSQKELASKLGISEKTLGEKLRGKTDFRIGEMRNIQMIFNKPLDYLFADRAE